MVGRVKRFIFLGGFLPWTLRGDGRRRLGVWDERM